MFRTILSRARRSAVVMAAIPALAFAQTGRISGTVTDGSKSPVAGAQILVTAVGLSAESGADGKYTVTGVPAGTYAVRVYRLGFKAKTMLSVSVTAEAAVPNAYEARASGASAASATRVSLSIGSLERCPPKGRTMSAGCGGRKAASCSVR